MKFIPCNTDVWQEAEKKATRKVNPKNAAAPSGRRDAKVAKAYKNFYGK